MEVAVKFLTGRLVDVGGGEVVSKGAVWCRLW